MSKFHLLFLFSVFLASLSQVMLKFSANSKKINSIKYFVNIKVFLSYVILMVCVFLNSWAFKGIGLGVAASLESFGYVLVVLYDKLFFEKKINFKKIMGVFFILSGTIVFMK